MRKMLYGNVVIIYILSKVIFCIIIIMIYINHGQDCI